jgi:radical SAM superfamily enzyme YgiQ (UPF0313 family)
MKRIKDIRKILLINPPYEPCGIKESVSSVSVTLSLAMLAGIARRQNKEVRVLDLNLSQNWPEILTGFIKNFSPDLVGITFTTPLLKISNNIALEIREALNNNIVIIGGGAHASAKPHQTLEETCFDAVAVGEAEHSFEEFLIKEDFANTAGWIFKHRDEILFSGKRKPISDLDALPFGAFDLFASEKYVYPRESARKNPVCLIETSRGCPARCIYCNKNIFGFKQRYKSSMRVVNEMEYILSQGFQEIHMADDSMTANLDHAGGICREIIARNLSFPWVPRSGVRVDKITGKLLELMKKAGCYHIPFGIESGNQEILDSIRKGITIDDIRHAVALAKSTGMETTGYFMFGLPGETPDTIRQTIDFALELQLDHIKFGAAVPYPGTPFFEDLEKQGNLKTFDWSKYTYATPPWEIYHHTNLERETLEKLTLNNTKLVALANANLHLKDTIKNAAG